MADRIVWYRKAKEKNYKYNLRRMESKILNKKYMKEVIQILLRALYR